MATVASAIRKLSAYLVPAEELQYAEYVFRFKAFNPLPEGQKAKGHKWFSDADKQSLLKIINALANTCGGVIDMRTVSGDPVKDLNVDDLQKALQVYHNKLYRDVLKLYYGTFGSLLIVRKSDVIITADSHMYTRGLAETVEVISFKELSTILSQRAASQNVGQTAGSQNVPSCLSGESLIFGGACTIAEVAHVEFKECQCKTAEALIDVIKNRYENTLFAMPNLQNGGDMILGVREDKTSGKYIFLGVALNEKDQDYIRRELSSFMQILNGIPRMWGMLQHIEIKEGTHWFLRFHLLAIPDHTCDGCKCSICPADGKKMYLVQLNFPHFPGGVFQREPEAFTLNEDGSISQIQKDHWLRIHQLDNTDTDAPEVNNAQSLRLDVEDNSSTMESVASASPEALPKVKTCEDDATVRWSKHSSHQKHFVHETAEISLAENCSLFKMSSPVSYTPPKNEIRGVLSDHSVLQTIDRAMTDKKAFGIAARSLFSCIRHSVSVEQPPNHLMDILVVDELASIIVFVICSMIEPPNDLRQHFAYSRTLGRILKMQIADMLNCADIVVQCQIMGVDESRSNSLKDQLEWFPQKCGNNEVCRALSRVLTVDETHFSDIILQDADVELSEEQLHILQGVTRNRFNFIEGPPGCGKTLLAQAICKKHGRDKSVYISKSLQLTNRVAHMGDVNVMHLEDESQLLTKFEELSPSVQHIVIDDAQNMTCSQDAMKEALDFCQEKAKTIHVFQDSRYQNFSQDSDKISFVDIYFKHRSASMYDGALFDTIKVIRRNSGMVGSYVTTTISDITPTSPVQCESRVRGDDVIIQHIRNLRSHENNGLVAHVKRILSESNVDPQDKHYKIQDVTILVDHPDQELLDEDIESFEQIFLTAFPGSQVQRAERFPARGIIIDSLDNFSGLEARVVIFVLPKIPVTDSVRSLSNPKYRIAIASRGLERVDFVQEENLDVDQLGELKFDSLSPDLLKNDTELQGLDNLRVSYHQFEKKFDTCYLFLNAPHQSQARHLEEDKNAITMQNQNFYLIRYSTAEEVQRNPRAEVVIHTRNDIRLAIHKIFLEMSMKTKRMTIVFNGEGLEPNQSGIPVGSLILDHDDPLTMDDFIEDILQIWREVVASLADQLHFGLRAKGDVVTSSPQDVSEPDIIPPVPIFVSVIFGQSYSHLFSGRRSISSKWNSRFEVYCLTDAAVNNGRSQSTCEFTSPMRLRGVIRDVVDSHHLELEHFARTNTAVRGHTDKQ